MIDLDERIFTYSIHLSIILYFSEDHALKG